MQHTALDSSRSVREAFAAGQGDLAIINVSIVANAFFRGFLWASSGACRFLTMWPLP